MGGGSSPGGGEADDLVGGVVDEPNLAEDAGCGEALDALVFQDHKLLIGRRFHIEWDLLFLQYGDELLRPLDGVGADAAVEIVRKKRVELDAEKTALGQ